MPANPEKIYLTPWRIQDRTYLCFALEMASKLNVGNIELFFL